MDADKMYYLAGPMSGIPQFNVPLFDAATEELREKGFRIVSPAELDSNEIREQALESDDGHFAEDGKMGGETYGEILGRDVRIIFDKIDGIVLLPGWEKSTGARLECYIGLLKDSKQDGEFTFWAYTPGAPIPVPHAYVKEFLYE